jgi:hypothetical protein
VEQVATDADTDTGTVAVAGIAGIVARVDELLTHAVQTFSEALAGESTAADPLRALFVSDTDARHLARRGSQPLGSTLGFERPLVDLAVAGPAWRRLAAVFGLTPAEVDIMALALVPEVDLRYERIFGYLHDDITRRRMTADLACQLLCESFEERLAARSTMLSDGALARYHLCALVPDAGQPQGPMLGHAVRLDEGIVELLLGNEAIDRRLSGAAHWDAAPIAPLPNEVARVVGLVLRAMRRPSGALRHFALLGTDAALTAQVARHIARELEQPLLVIDLSRLEHAEVGFAEAALLAARTARLFGALALWTGGEQTIRGADAEAAARLDRWLRALDLFGVQGTLLAVTEPPHASTVVDHFLSIELPATDAMARRGEWARRLAAHGVTIGQDDTLLLGEVFRLDGAGIGRAVDRAVASAHLRNPDGPRVTTEDLVESARLQILRALPRFATRAVGTQRWEDIVLPPDHLQQLTELCNRVRHRHLVLQDWGFARRLTTGRGVAALFSGPSGTGKTMAAQIIATSLGMELYRVEIPAVVSKYIGETEKALEQLFREAQGTSAILFFDEADALFGKRSEVKDAHDRYANIEVSYLLQAIEQYDGLTILATNLRQNVDEAFVRRLSFSVTFPFPEEPERRRLWAQCWPERVPVASDVDPDFLARQFKLTGGNIRNVALAAAFEAAADGGSVTMSHVVRGVRREFQKMGKSCVASEFGPWFAMLADGGPAA